MQNVSRFEVERSGDGFKFSTVGNLGAHGAGNYHWLDTQALPGTSFYRLRQIDFDGKHRYSPIRSVKLPEAVVAMHISPNPIRNGQFNVFFEKSDEEVQITVWDLQGKQLTRQSGSGEAGELAVELPGSVASGVVLVEMQYRSRRELVKGVVN